MQEVYIVSAVRTAMGSFGGALASVSATALGSAAIKGAIDKAGIDAKHIDEVFMGNVISAFLGQAPARQAALGAGVGVNVPCTTVNKVCASGTKAIIMGVQSIMAGQNDVVVAGGMESMTNIPFYLPKARYGYGYGHGQIVDGLMHDALTDAYSHKIMGTCGDFAAKEMGFTREEQDAYAVRSYKLSANSTEKGYFANEIVPVAIPQKRGEAVMFTEDEEYKKVFFDKIAGLKPVFSADGTITAANASTINDGASALILVSKRKMEELGLKPVAKILGFADAAREPEWFAAAPLLAAPKALKMAGLSIKDVDYVEVNEAFAVVPLIFNREMGLDPEKMNVFGGAVSLGHPLGSSGSRIVATLNNVLHQNKKSIGLAAICNGGGGAAALVIEAL